MILSWRQSTLLFHFHSYSRPRKDFRWAWPLGEHSTPWSSFRSWVSWSPTVRKLAAPVSNWNRSFPEIWFASGEYSVFQAMAVALFSFSRFSQVCISFSSFFHLNSQCFFDSISNPISQLYGAVSQDNPRIETDIWKGQYWAFKEPVPQKVAQAKNLTSPWTNKFEQVSTQHVCKYEVRFGPASK